MTTVETLHEFFDRVGEDLGVTDWVTINQDLIDRFADVTGDKNWYHVNAERASQELPEGRTIAHGLLTLSLVPGMAGQLMTVRNHGRVFNYGLNKARFPSAVMAGSRVRLRVQISSAKKVDNGMLLGRMYTMEIEGSDKPALVAEMLTLVL